MKISILKESLCIGGTERSVANISKALSKRHDVSMVLFDGKDIVYPYGGTLYDMQLPPQTRIVNKILNNVRRMRQYKKHMRVFKPDVVLQFITFRSPISKMQLRNCVKFVSARDFSVLSNNMESFKKCVDTSSGMICNSEYLRDYFVNRYPECRDKVFSVYNIIDIDLVNKQAECETTEDFVEFRNNHKYLVVAVGRFCKEKGFENLLAAFKKVTDVIPDVGLVLVGDGECKVKYLDIIEELNIADNVFFTGYQKNPYKYMAKCDLFVLSSQSEGFPNVLVEAMALSLPVISVNCYTGPAEILMKNYNYEMVKDSFLECDYGILTPHYDIKGVDFAVDQISKAIARLLLDATLMDKYRKLSACRASDFSDTVAVEKLEDIFNTLISRRNGL